MWSLILGLCGLAVLFFLLWLPGRLLLMREWGTWSHDEDCSHALLAAGFGACFWGATILTLEVAYGLGNVLLSNLKGSH